MRECHRHLKPLTIVILMVLTVGQTGACSPSAPTGNGQNGGSGGEETGGTESGDGSVVAMCRQDADDPDFATAFPRDEFQNLNNWEVRTGDLGPGGEGEDQACSDNRDGTNRFQASNVNVVSDSAAADGLALRLTVPPDCPARGGEVSTQASFGYGTYRARLRVSEMTFSERGIVAGFFNYSGGAEVYTEIDFEILSQDTSRVFCNAWIRESTQYRTSKYPRIPLSDATDYHVYRFDWHAEYVEFYVDEQPLLDDESNPIRITDFVPCQPAPVHFNAWTGNLGFGGRPPNEAVHMWIDWFEYTPFLSDSDGDGTPDDDDGCPLDSNKVSPGECGCGEPEVGGCGDSECDNGVCEPDEGTLTCPQDCCGPASQFTADAGPDWHIERDECVTFSGTASGGIPPYRYGWRWPLAFQSGQDIGFCFPESGTAVFTLEVTDSDGQSACDAVSVYVYE